MKFLIIGDLHGKKPKILFKDFDAIIAPGDFCSDKGFRPYINQWLKNIKKGKEGYYEDLIYKKIGKKGYKKLERESLEAGRKVFEELNKLGKPVYIVPGNWDQSYNKKRKKVSRETPYQYEKEVLDIFNGKETNKKLKQGLKNIIDCQFKLHKNPEINIIGYGLSCRPEKTRRTVKKDMTKKQWESLQKHYKKILNRLTQEYKKRDKTKPTLFITHNVPHKTKLDKIIKKGSFAHNKHYGSSIARDFCTKHQPLFCVGSHIHEHFGKDKIKKTTIVNAGFGSNVNILVEIKNNKIKQLKFKQSKKVYNSKGIFIQS